MVTISLSYMNVLVELRAAVGGKDADERLLKRKVEVLCLVSPSGI